MLHGLSYHGVGEVLRHEGAKSLHGWLVGTKCFLHKRSRRKQLRYHKLIGNIKNSLVDTDHKLERYKHTL